MKDIRTIAFTSLLALALCHGAMAHSIPVSDVEDLYRVVNEPANAGATVVLAPGIYSLSVSDSAGAVRPKAGRIELQADMSLLGVKGNRSAVIIDAAALPASSFPQTVNGLNLGPNAAVRLGLGSNSLEWLTVRNAAAAQANIDTGLQALDTLPTSIRIAHVDSTGSVRGLNVYNFGVLAAGQTLEADISDSRFFDNDAGLSQGIRIGNFSNANGSTVNVRLSGNSSTGQKAGMLIVNNGSSDSSVTVQSSGDQFQGNGAGVIVFGGFSSTSFGNARADRNTVVLEAQSDYITGNRGASDLDRGGLIVLGAEDISATGGASYNTVNVKLRGSKVSDNIAADLTAIGARSPSAATAVHNQFNQVTVDVRGPGNGNGKWTTVEAVADSAPAVPNYWNSARIDR